MRVSPCFTGQVHVPPFRGHKDRLRTRCPGTYAHENKKNPLINPVPVWSVGKKKTGPNIPGVPETGAKSRRHEQDGVTADKESCHTVLSSTFYYFMTFYGPNI